MEEVHKHICEYCGFIGKSKRALSVHRSKCELNPEVINKRNSNNKYECRYCHNEFDTLKLCIGHVRLCTLNPKYENNLLSIRIVSNKRIGMKMPKSACETISQKRIRYALEHPEEFIKTKGNFRTQRYYYDDIVFDSSWEIIAYLYFKHHGVNIVKSYFAYKYTYKDKEHVYFPDFYLPDTDELIEIKGREFERDRIKYKSVDKKLTVYYQDDIIRFNAWNKLHIDNYDISKYKIRNKPLTKHEKYQYDLDIRHIIKDIENKELFFHSLFNFGIDYSEFGCWTKLQQYLSFKFDSPQVTGRWFKEMFNKYGNEDRFTTNPYTNEKVNIILHRRCR